MNMSESFLLKRKPVLGLCVCDFVILKSPTPQMNDIATPFGVLGRMCFQKIPIPSLNVTFNTTAIQKQLFFRFMCL